MATPAEDDPQQQESEDLREALYRVYSVVEGRRFTQTAAALTVEDCLDLFIAQAEGTGTKYRPTELERLDQLLERVQSTVARVKATPEVDARPVDPEQDVNTYNDEDDE